MTRAGRSDVVSPGSPHAKAEGAPALPLDLAHFVRVVQRIDVPGPRAANRIALEELEFGASGLALVFAGAPTARGFGLGGDVDLAAVLDGVRLDAIAIRLETAPFEGAPVRAAFAGLVHRLGLAAAALDLDLGLDPLGDMARLGGAPAAWPVLEARLAAEVAGLQARGLAGALVRADGRTHHEAGASDAEELGAVLATAVAYLRALERAGGTLEGARDNLGFTLAADADLFASIAKCRALRLSWAAVERACGLDPRPLRLHVETAWRALTRLDPATNLLRGTLGCVAALLGGADSVCVLPHTLALGLPDAAARGLARNTPLLALEEAHLGRVLDPAAGSGGIEALTAALRDAAWRSFQDIERGGGLAAALASGRWQDRLAAARERRRDDHARRRAIIVGTSDFVEPDEAAVAVWAEASRTALAPFAPGAGGIGCEPLPSVRDAEPYETLRARARAERHAGRDRAVFLARLGAGADEADLARRLLEVGGFRVVDGGRFASRDGLVAAFRASGARAACLCASEDAGASRDAGRLVTEAGAASVLAASREGDEASVVSGIDGALSPGCDAPAILSRLHDRLGGAR